MRRYLPLALAVAVAFAVPAQAEVKKKLAEYTDAAGDSLPPQGSTDIVKVSYETSGEGKGKKYVPKLLVVTMELAGPPATQFVSYEMRQEVSGCGYLSFLYTPGGSQADGIISSACYEPEPTTGSPNIVLFSPKVDGNKVIWRVNLVILPKPVKLGATFSGLTAMTQYAEPVTGILGTGILSNFGLVDITDRASSPASFKLG
jgi:hypothetical protein